MGLNRDQKKKISDLVAGLAQIIFGSIVIGQFFPSAGKYYGLFFSCLGATIALACCIFSVTILGKENKEWALWSWLSPLFILRSASPSTFGTVEPPAATGILEEGCRSRGQVLTWVNSGLVLSQDEPSQDLTPFYLLTPFYFNFQEKEEGVATRPFK